ncbi:hypothetical protein PR048_010497 [Dryococelus australis]|uniref:DDE-1 domain-containing protein n=1 Tax=Dryococelus australis TaxID=614101 RepID=A0ABQ9I2Y2_9NEOP|nr:hypothetical protein PR048_010497 [Dryococelus australis]
MQELWSGLTVNHVRVIAFEVAEASGGEHLLNTEKKCASKKGWTNFKQPYGLTLESLKTCQHRSHDYFYKLTDTMVKLNIQHKPEDHVWNVDETGIMHVVDPGKNYGERGETMTLVGSICANGTWIPPFIIFNGARWNAGFKYSSPSVTERLDNKELFIIWFKFFLACTTGSPRPILVLMDAHGSHITPDVIELVR